MPNPYQPFLSQSNPTPAYPIHPAVMMGDSLTKNNLFGVLSSQFYPASLRTFLNAAGCKVFEHNLGISGQTSTQMLARARTMLQYGVPSLAVILAGENDSGNSISSTVTQQNIQQSLSTTIALSVSTGSQTVTPASLTGIVVGSTLWVANADGSNGEAVVVTATPGGGAFTATFTTTKGTNSVVTAAGMVDLLIAAGCPMIVIATTNLKNFPSSSSGDLSGTGPYTLVEPSDLSALATLRTTQQAAATAAIAAYPPISGVPRIALCDTYDAMFQYIGTQNGAIALTPGSGSNSWVNAASGPGAINVYPGSANIHPNALGQSLIARKLFSVIEAQQGWIGALSL